MVVKDELSGLNRELSMFPTRAFEFRSAGTVIIEQDVADVGSVVWDAEVLLAHHLDLTYGFRLRGKRVVELGAGTGLAGIVAARLGADVLITDQSKLLPTIVKNARDNAPELEGSSRPHSHALARSPPPPPPSSRPSERQETREQSPLPRSTNGTAIVARRERGASTFHASAVHASETAVTGALDTGYGEAPPAPDGPREKHETASESGESFQDAAAEMQAESRDRQAHACFRGRDAVVFGAEGGAGVWRAMELLFSEDVDETLRAMPPPSWPSSREKSVAEPLDSDRLFDLVVAADVVYLRELWDAMASTIKALLRPGGEALVTFEQRRSNVDGFFGPPRFGNGSVPPSKITIDEKEKDCWKDGEEIDFAQKSGEELGEAANLANVRMFRIARKCAP